MSDLFLSGDWGTSALRIRLVDTSSLRVMAEEYSGEGIGKTFLRWKESGETGPEGPERPVPESGPGKRIRFYLDRIRDVIRVVEEREAISLRGVPLFLSGMASSSAGLMELPYRELPFHIDRDKLLTRVLDMGDDFEHPVFLISGLTNGKDVMRGEEVQLIGCLQGGMGDADRAGGDGLYIFPGTHSKHILVKERTIIDLKTYMTGELFSLLSRHGLLSGSVESGLGLGSPAAIESFRKGVADARGANLLHAAFRVRTNDVFGALSKRENFHYLSGLLIGTELEDLADLAEGNGEIPVLYLCSGAGLREYYASALEVTGLSARAVLVAADRVDTAVVGGQYFIFNQSNR